MSIIDLSSKTLWDSAMSKIQQINPGLWSKLRLGEIVSAEGNIFIWQPIKECDSVFPSILNRIENKEQIIKILTETSKAQCGFIAKEIDPETSYINRLYETFGKEPVDIRDDNTNENTNIADYAEEMDEESYTRECIKEALGDSTETLDNTFEKLGFDLLQYSWQYSDECLFCYLELEGNTSEIKSDYVHAQVNLYDGEGNIIAISSKNIKTSDFDGYDTIAIEFTDKNIFIEAYEAKIFMARGLG